MALLLSELFAQQIFLPVVMLIDFNITQSGSVPVTPVLDVKKE